MHAILRTCWRYGYSRLDWGKPARYALAALLLLIPGTAKAEDIFVSAPPTGSEISSSDIEWQDIPGLEGTIETRQSSTLAITVSGEVDSSAPARMFVRAMVDDVVAEPFDVLFVEQDFTGSRSFTFVVKKLNQGIHTAKIQWRSDHGDIVSFGDRSLSITALPSVTADGGQSVVAAVSDQDKTTTSTDWVDVPDLQTGFVAAAGGSAAITVSAEADASPQKRMYLRALIDGQPTMLPEVDFAAGKIHGVRSFTFIGEQLSAGPHSAKIQWKSDAGGTAYIGDRTLTVTSSTAAGVTNQLSVASAGASGYEMTGSAAWRDVPGLHTQISTHSGSLVKVTVSGVVNATSGNSLVLRALVDGVAAEPGEVVLAAERPNAARSFTFIKEELRAGSHEVTIQWRVEPGGYAFFEERTLAVLSQRPSSWRTFTHIGNPHLYMKEPNIPQVLTPLFSDIDTVLRVPTLVVLMDYDNVAPTAASTIAFYNDLIFGTSRASGAPSVFELYRENSNGRVLLEPARAGDTFDGKRDGFIDWNQAAVQSGCCKDANGDHLADLDQAACTTGGFNWDPGSSEYYDCHAEEKRAQGILVADPLFDFSKYDRNGDKKITNDELVFIVINADGKRGANARQTSPARVSVDNGSLDVLQWITGVSEVTDIGAIGHELGHALLGLEDIYSGDIVRDATGYKFCHQRSAAGVCTNIDAIHYPPDPGFYSLISAPNPSEWIQHLDPWAKIHLGFVRPLIIGRGGDYSLHAMEAERDMRRQVEEPEVALIYNPNSERPFEKYFILENRNRSEVDAAGRTQTDTGLAIWLIDESEDIARKRIQLVRRSGYWGPELQSFWDDHSTMDGYDFTATSVPRNSQWPDGSRSGIEVFNISPAGPVMNFSVRIE